LTSCNGQSLGVISQPGCAATSAASPVRLNPLLLLQRFAFRRKVMAKTSFRP
jgi:hypothetical protein